MILLGWLAFTTDRSSLGIEHHDWAQPATSLSSGPVSYDKTTPPGTGCEDVVARLQRLVLEGYAEVLEGVRYANMWGYLGE